MLFGLKQALNNGGGIIQRRIALASPLLMITQKTQKNAFVSPAA